MSTATQVFFYLCPKCHWTFCAVGEHKAPCPRCGVSVTREAFPSDRPKSYVQAPTISRCP
jgi:hypothetical protein